MAFYSYFSFALVLCVSIAVGQRIRDKIYEHMCASDQTFRQELIKCLEGMPREDQMIFQACGMSLANDSAEDFSVIIQDMCDDYPYANKVANCVVKVHHLIYHLEDDDHHGHTHDDHEDDEDHPHFDFGHHIYNEECFKRLYNSYNFTAEKESEEK